MNLNTYKHRNRYSTMVFVAILFTMISLLALIIYSNFDMLKLLFTYRAPEPTVPAIEQTYNNVLAKVYKLEELSYQYNKEGYQKRVLNYIRSESYDDEIWDYLAGDVDEGFVTYVKENQGTLNLESLTSPMYLTIPGAEYTVDFVHMVATMDALAYSGDSMSWDLAGWAGDLYQLIFEFKDTALEGAELVEKIKELNFYENYGTFGTYDVNADVDAVNIMGIYNRAEEKSIYLTLKNYFDNASSIQRIDNFKTSTFASIEYDALKAEVTAKITTNIYVQLLEDSYGIDITVYTDVIDACVTDFVDYIY